MSNIENAFKNGKAFIPFITCGDPNLETTIKIVRTMQDAGADLIELGIPFSDPTAEGPVIQDANIRALKNKFSTDDIFEMVRDLRKDITIPLVFMTYANVVFSYGIEKFVKTASEIGIDGIILPDVPFEERDEFLGICDNYDIDFISLIAPTSEDRIELIARDARGFLYIVSSLGVTGVRNNITTDISSMVELVKNANPNIPSAVGFGISTPEQAFNMTRTADGAIVGSAIVRIVEKYGIDAPKYVYDYVKSMKDAVMK